MPEQSTRPLILLSTYFPYGSGEVFLENEIAVLADHFRQVYLLPMLPYGKKRNLDERVTLLDPTPPSCSKSADFFRGLTDRKFVAEWRTSPGFPGSMSQLYLVARTLGIARRVESRILQTVREHGLENGIIYAYWMSQSCLGGVHTARTLGWPLVSRAHGGDLYTERYTGNYLPWHETKIRGASRIFTVSEDGSRYLSDRYPDISNRFCVSRLGVSDRGTTRHTPGSGTTLHLVSCSTVLPLKRVDLIYRTASELARLHPDRTIRWTHFGDGPDFGALQALVEKQVDGDAASSGIARGSTEQGILREETPQRSPRKEAAEGNHTQEQINTPADGIFSTVIGNLQVHLAGRAANDAIIRYYQQEEADLFINYSTTEGVPVSIMESFSCGIPAVAPRIGGMQEIIQESNGHLFDMDDQPENVAALISGLWRDGRLASMGEEARKMWASRYNRDENYRRFARELMEVQR